jgi:hypothetical protein
VSYPQIEWILEQEPWEDFQSVHNVWRPRHLLFLRQVQLLLKDVQRRYTELELAQDEFKTLEQSARYIKYLQRMRLWVRQAGFVWQADQLKFITSVAGFYADYGSLLRLLRIDQQRGKFSEPEKTTT